MIEKKKTALVLGGGGARGAYEVGVWQALKEMGIRPDIVTGTSIGALNGAVIVQDIFETASDFWQQLETSTLFDIKDVIAKGGIHYDELKTQLLEHIDEQVIRESKMDFGIVTVELNTVTPKHLWKEDIPEGMLIDYILASASCFPAISSYEIGDNHYIDGLYSDNLPVDLALSRGAERIIAVDLDSIGFSSKESLELAEESILIKSQWELGHFLMFERDHTKHLMRLGYLDALKAFSAYDGSAYCFIKGQMDRRTLKGAEAAGRIFHLDPELIYSKDAFQQALRQAVADHQKKDTEEIQRASKTMKSAIWSALSKALSPLTSESLTLAAAQYLDTEQELRSPILGRAAKALFGKEISAAQYLVKENIIPAVEDHIETN